jgi:acetoin utilization protein AcuB
MLVRYFMSRGVKTVDVATTCRAALRQMREQRLRRTPVVDDGRLVGMLSERDLLRVLPGTIAQADTAAGVESESLPVSRVMATKLVTVDADDHVETAARAMLEHKVGGLPVLHGGQLVGILTESDVFRAFTRMLATEGTLRVSFGFLENTHAHLSFADFVRNAGGELVGLQVYPRPGGQRLCVLRMRGGDSSKLISALSGAGCSLMEVLDDRESAATR